jgi:hypothetical protein
MRARAEISAAVQEALNVQDPRRSVKAELIALAFEIALDLRDLIEQDSKWVRQLQAARDRTPLDLPPQEPPWPDPPAPTVVLSIPRWAAETIRQTGYRVVPGHEVIRAHDALRDEITRRYRAGTL